MLEQIEKAFSSLSECPERGSYLTELLDIGIREYRESLSEKKEETDCNVSSFCIIAADGNFVECSRN